MRSLHIGLVNNMPDAALQATERQFKALLHAGARDIDIHFSLYALPDVPRSEAGHRHLSERYLCLEALWQSELDALIVTGAEPTAQDIVDEPYWESLTRVIDWADHNTYSSIWSCLATHAAVRCIDGIKRRRLAEKRFGLFEFVRASNHVLTAGCSASTHVPHSRWNDLAEAELVDHGYCILRRARDGSVDSFVKKRESLFVLFQGHPEYEANTLLREYRRDVGRFLRGERDTYPTMPHGYLSSQEIDALTNLQLRALEDRREELLHEFPAGMADKTITTRWRPNAVKLYTNWLNYLCEQKAADLESRQLVEVAYAASGVRKHGSEGFGADVNCDVV